MFKIILLLVALFTACFYLYIKYLFSYWDRRGVKSLQPSLPFGNFAPNFLQRQSIAELYQSIYNAAATEPFIGIYCIIRPILVIREPKLIQRILIKDFQHFVDRGMYVNEEVDPLSAHLFAIEGKKWKILRAKLSPTFTTGKLKAMFSTLVDCTEPLKKRLDESVKNNESIEIRELAACYTTNVIASVAFGINVDSFADPTTPFRKYGRKVFELNLMNSLRFLMMFMCPKIMKLLKIRIFDKDVADFMMGVVEQTLELREKRNIVRKDFFQLLIQIRNAGNVLFDDQWNTLISEDSDKKLTVEEITAHAFVFFLAGFETSAAAISYCLYEISKNQAIQLRVQSEIDKVLDRFDGQLTYESINELKYLEACIDETNRKYSVAPFLNRECTEEYTIPETNVVIEKGTFIVIPNFALQRDPKYYPNPNVFDPTRFLDENGSPKSFADRPYLPFGDGPRNCIGIRLGKIQTKIGLVPILRKFNFYLSEEHLNNDLEFSPAAFVLTPVKSIHIKATSR